MASVWSGLKGKNFGVDDPSTGKPLVIKKAVRLDESPRARAGNPAIIYADTKAGLRIFIFEDLDPRLPRCGSFVVLRRQEVKPTDAPLKMAAKSVGLEPEQLSGIIVRNAPQ